MSRTKGGRDRATTMFALVLWDCSALFVAVGASPLWSHRDWALLLWLVLGLVFIRVGWDLWKMGRPPA